MSGELPAFSLDALPDDLKTAPTLKDFKTWPDVAKSYDALVKKMGVPAEQLLRLAPDGSIPPEVWKRLGKPEKPEDYKFPENLKSRFEDQYKKRLVEFADKHNLTKTQFEELTHFTDGLAQERIASDSTAREQARKDAEAALKANLGSAYEQSLNFAKDAEQMLEAPGLLDKLKAANLDTDPMIIGVLTKIGRLGGEDTIVNGQVKGFRLTPNEAKAEINSLKADKEFMERYTTKHHLGHKEAVARMKELLEASQAQAA